MAERETGVVKWFNSTKRFGFITREGQEGCLRPLQLLSGVRGYRALDEGQQVEFEVAQSDKGPQAQDVTAIS